MQAELESSSKRFLITTRWGHILHLQGFQGVLRAAFPNQWPEGLPDLSPPDYFLWAYFKSLVNKDRSKTLENLRNKMRAEIGNIPVYMLENVAQSFRNRLHQCIDNGQRQLTDIVFKAV
ncbi:uncharacterized protein TNCV_2094181 [Trichonephila clavipes]|nr:uncharacterized protein TNCV_2094181 [Trichonephila clavipes]